MRVKVEIPFHFTDLNADLVKGDEIEVNEQQLARIRAVNINMVSVIGEVEETKPKTRTKKSK